MFNASRLGLSKACGTVTPAITAVLLFGTLQNQDAFTAKADAPPLKVEKVKAAIADLIEQDADKRGDGTSLTGTFVRLAWHCAGK